MIFKIDKKIYKIKLPNNKINKNGGKRNEKEISKCVNNCSNEYFYPHSLWKQQRRNNRNRSGRDYRNRKCCDRNNDRRRKSNGKAGDFMPYISPEVVEQARQIDLLTYLQSCEPQELVRISGNNYTTRTHDSLKISNGKWMWWSQRIGGYNALDYLVKVKGCSFVEAVETLMGKAAVLPTVKAQRIIPSIITKW